MDYSQHLIEKDFLCCGVTYVVGRRGGGRVRGNGRLEAEGIVHVSYCREIF